MVRVLSVGLLEAQGELDELLRIHVELVRKVELLVHVLQHKVETVLLGQTVQIEGIEVVAVYLLIVLQHLFIDGVLHFEQFQLLFHVRTLGLTTLMADPSNAKGLMPLLLKDRTHPVVDYP